MSRITRVVTGTTALVLAGCMDFNGARDTNTLELSEAFQSVPVGFSNNSTTFDSAGDLDRAFYPGPLALESSGIPSSAHREPGDSGQRKDGAGEDHRGTGDKRDGFGGRGLRGILMGGGLGHEFLGGVPFGWGKGRGPFGWFHLPDSCTYSAITFRVSCPDKTRDGLTIRVSFAFTDTAGDPQPKFDTASTDGVNVKVSVTGTKVRRDSSISEVDHGSDRTVTGLATGSTERTVFGTAHAREETTGERDGIAFTALRLATDSTRGLVIPLQENHPTIPSAGKIIRTMFVSITKDSTTRSKSRREEITFDGSNVVSVIITQDGETKNCTITLPSRKLVCAED